MLLLNSALFDILRRRSQNSWFPDWSNHNSVTADVAYFKPIRNNHCNKRDGKDETEWLMSWLASNNGETHRCDSIYFSDVIVLQNIQSISFCSDIESRDLPETKEAIFEIFIFHSFLLLYYTLSLLFLWIKIKRFGKHTRISPSQV